MKCTTTTLLATFMWRRPLNSATLTTATHRAPGKVADGTNTQVGTQIINKWRVKMTPKKIYKVEDSSWRMDQKREKEETLAI